MSEQKASILEKERAIEELQTMLSSSEGISRENVGDDMSMSDEVAGLLYDQQRKVRLLSC